MHHSSGEMTKDHARLHSLMELAALINSSLNPSDVRRMAVDEIPACVGADAASLLLLDPETEELYFEVACGEHGEKLEQLRLGPGEGIAGWVARRGGAIIVDDVENDQRFASKVDQFTGCRTRNMIVAPVATREKLWGVLQVINKQEGNFTDEDLELVQALANHVAIAIENASIYQEMRQTFLGVTTALADALEKRDSYTGGHTRRVNEYSETIAKRLGLPEDEMDALRLAAILHDIGKIGVSDQVLRKPGRLDEKEFVEMAEHPEVGVEIIRHLPQLARVIPGVLHHHEKFDGSGYPSGLAGDEIPFIARIIAVADSFDAMTSERPYRKALSVDYAFEELERFSGRQFDPKMVFAFIEAWKAGDIARTD